MFAQTPQIPNVPKKELRIILPHLQKMSQIIKTRLTKTMNNHLKLCKLRVNFQTSNTLKNCFHLKDFVPESLRLSLKFINFRAEAV